MRLRRLLSASVRVSRRRPAVLLGLFFVPNNFANKPFLGALPLLDVIAHPFPGFDQVDDDPSPGPVTDPLFHGC